MRYSAGIAARFVTSNFHTLRTVTPTTFSTGWTRMICACAAFVSPAWMATWAACRARVASSLRLRAESTSFCFQRVEAFRPAS